MKLNYEKLYYELGKIYFELLNLAATQLEKLSREQIAKLSDGEEIAKVNNSLGEYLDKVAMVFQAAADNTEGELYQKTYSLEAENYSQQADAVRGIFRIQTHTQKMFALYTKAAQTCEMPFIREVLEERTTEYSRKLEAEKLGASRSMAASIDASSESDSLLHHRHPHQSGEGDSLEPLICRQ